MLLFLRPFRDACLAGVLRSLDFVEIHAEPGFVVRIDITLAKFGEAGEHCKQCVARAFEVLENKKKRLGERPFLHAEVACGQVDVDVGRVGQR